MLFLTLLCQVVCIVIGSVLSKFLLNLGCWALYLGAILYHVGFFWPDDLYESSVWLFSTQALVSTFAFS